MKEDFMLTAEGCHARRMRLWERVSAQAPVEAIVVSEPAHLVYLANFYASPFEFRSANAAALLIVSANRATLISDNLQEPFARAAHVDEVVTPLWYRGRESAVVRRQVLIDAAWEVLSSLPSGHWGVETSSVPAALVERGRAAKRCGELIDISGTLHQLKRAKDADEMAILRRSLAASDAAMAAAVSETKPGMTELEVARIVQDVAARAAGHLVQIYGDFVSGPHCQQRGGPPSNRVIEPGDPVLLDYSVVLHGYRGDVCRTFVCGAEPTARQRQLADLCVAALEAGTSALRPGTPAREVDAAVRRTFAAQNMEEFFTSHSGHGLGLGHPDPPYLVRHSSDTLAKGDVVAVEPGLYIDGEIGMRFEHNFVVTAQGPERLSNHRLDIAQR